MFSEIDLLCVISARKNIAAITGYNKLSLYTHDVRQLKNICKILIAHFDIFFNDFVIYSLGKS